MPAYNDTVTSNFESIGGNSFQVPNSEALTPKHPKQPKVVKGISMDDARMPMKASALSDQAQMNLPQFRRMKKSKNRKHGDESENYHMDSNSASKVTDQILNSTTAAATPNSRHESHKMNHYSEGARHHGAAMGSPHGYH